PPPPRPWPMPRCPTARGGRGTRRCSTSVPASAPSGPRPAGGVPWPAGARGPRPGGPIRTRPSARRACPHPSRASRAPTASAGAEAGRAGAALAVGAAGVSAPPSRFEGSDRQGGGRLVDALRARGRVPAASLAEAAGWPDDPDRARRVAATLVADGLATDDAG